MDQPTAMRMFLPLLPPLAATGNSRRKSGSILPKKGRQGKDNAANRRPYRHELWVLCNTGTGGDPPQKGQPNDASAGAIASAGLRIIWRLPA
jgi:hypothetical protein